MECSNVNRPPVTGDITEVELCMCTKAVQSYGPAGAVGGAAGGPVAPGGRDGKCGFRVVLSVRWWCEGEGTD